MSTYNTIHQAALYLYPPPASLNELTDKFFDYIAHNATSLQFNYIQTLISTFNYKGITHQCRTVKLPMIVKSPYTYTISCHLSNNCCLYEQTGVSKEDCNISFGFYSCSI